MFLLKQLQHPVWEGEILTKRRNWLSVIAHTQVNLFQYFDWVLIKQSIIPQQNSTGPFGLKHLPQHLSASLRIANYLLIMCKSPFTEIKERQMENLCKKKKNQDSAVSSRLKRSLCITYISWPQSSSLNVQSDNNLHSCLADRGSLHMRDHNMEIQRLPNPASGVFQIQNSSPLNRLLSLQLKKGRILAILSLNVLWASSQFLEIFTLFRI